MTEPKRRGRPPKARLEGAESYAAIVQGSEVERRPDPVPGNNGAALARIAAYFKAEHEAEWESMRLCPLESGLEAMIGLLK